MLMSCSALAIPNLWSYEFGQGNTTYDIENQNGASFTINCTGNPDENNTLQHSVTLSLPKGETVNSYDKNDPSIVVVIDDEQYGIPSSLGWRNADNAWYNFIEAIGKATTFDVYLNNKPVGTWKPSKKNVSKVLNGIQTCASSTYE
ncbi:hypothetical protein [Proteus sp. TSJ240517]